MAANIETLRETEACVCRPVDLERFETVENDWGILYDRCPEAYDRFCETGRDGAPERLIRRILQEYEQPLLLDIGCGTGRSLLPYLDLVKEATAVDISEEMLRVARRNISTDGYVNVKLVPADVCQLPFSDEEFDVVLADNLVVWDPNQTPHPSPKLRIQKWEQAILEAVRVLKRGGACAFLGLTPGWYGGSLAPVVLGNDHLDNIDQETMTRESLFPKYGFEVLDFISEQNFSSPEEMASIYGFIYGRRVIRHILETYTTQVKWKFRLYLKTKG